MLTRKSFGRNQIVEFRLLQYTHVNIFTHTHTPYIFGQRGYTIFRWYNDIISNGIMYTYVCAREGECVGAVRRPTGEKRADQTR